MRIRWTIAVIAAAALAWVVITIQQPWHTSGDDVTPPGGAACPADAVLANLELTAPDITGREVSLSEYSGQVVLLNFWATWCGPCRVEIPWFVEFQEKFGAAGLQVIGVSVDDPVEKLEPYIANMKMNYVVLQGLNRPGLLEAYGPIVGLPMTVMIARDGRICLRHTGLASKEELERQIESLL